MAKGLILSFLLVLLWIAVKLIALHVLRPKSVFPVATLLFALTVPAYLALYLGTSPDLFVLPPGLVSSNPLFGLVNGLIVHFMLYCTWMEFYYAVVPPLTLRILQELMTTPDGRLTYEQLQAVYGLEAMIDRRLKTLTVNGYVEERNGKIHLTSKGEILSKGIQLFRAFFATPYYLDLGPRNL